MRTALRILFSLLTFGLRLLLQSYLHSTWQCNWKWEVGGYWAEVRDRLKSSWSRKESFSDFSVKLIFILICPCPRIGSNFRLHADVCISSPTFLTALTVGIAGALAAHAPHDKMDNMHEEIWRYSQMTSDQIQIPAVRKYLQAPTACGWYS